MNPYSPPDSPSEPLSALPGSIIKAVSLGMLVDVGGTLLGVFVLVVVYSAMMASRGMAEAELTQAVHAYLYLGWGLLISSALGSLFSALGGYVCARVARRPDYKPALIMCSISLVLGLTGWNDYTLPVLVAINLATILCTLGGYRLGMTK